MHWLLVLVVPAATAAAGGPWEIGKEQCNYYIKLYNVTTYTHF
jgi:hypothetical protein